MEIEILNNVRKFLIEMGGYFTFIGNQYKLNVEGEEFSLLTSNFSPQPG
jgi:predicted nuclease of restriction endonuclease-like (RecB) superfamily